MSIQKLDKYQLHEELGRGGYGTVYRSTDTVLEVPRAVKVLHPALVADPSFIERFRREAKFAARMKHPHIVPVYDLGEAEGRFFLAMEYLPSGSLKDLLTKDSPLPFQRALEITQQISDALNHIHKQELIHRDVKPGNILFDDDGNAYLSDLGFAKALSSAGNASLSVTGGMIGTPAYMAPEIWMGQEASPQSDIYSLACVLVEMLTGTSLFGGEGDSPPPLVMKRHFDPLELPGDWPVDVPGGLKDVLEAALAKEPQQRCSGATEFVEALQNLEQNADVEEAVSLQPSAVSEEPDALRDEPSAVISKPAEEKQPRPQRWRLWAGFGITAALLGLCGLVFYISSRSPSPEVVIETVVVEVTSTAAEIALMPTDLPTSPPDTPSPTPTSTATLIPTAPQLGIGSTQVAGADGIVQVFVPEGEFEMGGNEFDDEKPIHSVYLDAFWIDQMEVTNAMFAAFLNDKGNQSEGGANWLDASDDDVLIEQNGGVWQAKSGFADHPVIEVTWYGANAYCEWAGRRLPTEAEWEKAARGGLEGEKYPWGDQAPVCASGAENGAQFVDCAGDTVVVGNYSPNGYGLYDMAGNVWEWVADWYDESYYQNSSSDNPEGPESGGYRVLRGGSWNYNVGVLRSAFRVGSTPDDTDLYNGFRCARSP